MIPLYLDMRNFMCYAAASLPFDGIGLACLTGENGHGKSAVLDALTWALWGKSRTQRDDDLVRLGETDMTVNLRFALGDNEYRVLRQRHKNGSRGTSSLQFQIRDGDQYRALTGDAIRETQELITRTLRMDYETFINSAFLVQGRADEFTTKAPAERKRVLADILDLSLYDELEQRAKDRIREIEGRLRGLEAAIEQIEEELGRKAEYKGDLNRAKAESEKLAGELKEAQETLRRLQDVAIQLSHKQEILVQFEKENQARQHELTGLRERIRQAASIDEGQYENQLTAVREELAKLADLEAERQPLQEDAERLSNEMTALRTTNDQLKVEMDNLKTEIGVLTGAEAECPLCGTALSEDHRDDILASKQAEGEAKASTYRENAERVKAAGTERGRALDALGELDAKLQGAAKLREQEITLSESLTQAKGQKERVAEWEARVEELIAGIRESEERATAVSLEVKTLSESAGRLPEQRRLVDDLDIRAAQAKQQLGAAQQKLDHCDYLEGQRAEKEDELEGAQQQRATYEELRTAFGKRGVQAMIIEAAIPEIEDEANRLLGRMTDGMHVRFKSQRETLKGDIRETLDIEVADEMGPRDYSLFSGGEAFRINFAIRIAISKLLARRAGAKLQTLIIDEGFGSQDAGGRQRLVEAIGSVAGDFARILVITHIEELKDSFPARIDVFKTPRGSQITVA